MVAATVARKTRRTFVLRLAAILAVIACFGVPSRATATSAADAVASLAFDRDTVHLYRGGAWYDIGPPGATDLIPSDVVSVGPIGRAYANYPSLADCVFHRDVGIGIGTPSLGYLFAIDWGAGSEQYCNLASGSRRSISTLNARLEITGTTIGMSFDGTSPDGTTVATVFEGSATLHAPTGPPIVIRAGETYVVRGRQGRAENITGQRPALNDEQIALIERVNGVVVPTLAPRRSAFFYGSVSLNQAPVAGQATVEALVGNTVCGSGAVMPGTLSGSSPILINPQTGQPVSVTVAPASSTYSVEVAAAINRRGCARDGDTLTFRLRRGNELIPLTPTAIFRPGAEIEVNLSGSTQPSCTALSAVTLTATPTDRFASSNQLQWQATGNCGPFTGTITARYADRSEPYARYPISAPSGMIVDDRAPGRCEGHFDVEYTIELFDSRGGRATRTVNATVYFLC